MDTRGDFGRDHHFNFNCWADPTKFYITSNSQVCD